MNIKHIISNASIAARQKKNLVIAGSVFIILAFVGLSYFSDDTKSKKKANVKETTVVTALDTIDPSDVWLYKSESRLENQDDAIEDLKKRIDKIQRTAQPGVNDAQVNEEIEARMMELEQMMATVLEAKQSGPNVVGSAVMPSQKRIETMAIYEEGAEYLGRQETQILSLNMGLKPRDDDSLKLNVDNFIPVGSFAKAVLLTGVDAPAAVSSADNPVPMLLRIVDDAVLPRGLRGKVDTCHITASAYGEISEERVRVRLDKISCTYKDGRVFVDNIDGYVAGEDGKNGIRGTVVWREGALLARSFAAGFLGGVSQGIGDAAGETSTSPLGTVQSYPGSDLFQQGIGTGAGSALNKLSEYYVKRAEQYHPIIEVEAGRLVDIVLSTKKESKNNGLKLEEENNG